MSRAATDLSSDKPSASAVVLHNKGRQFAFPCAVLAKPKSCCCWLVAGARCIRVSKGNMKSKGQTHEIKRSTRVAPAEWFEGPMKSFVWGL